MQCLSAVSSSISVMRSRLPPFLPSHPISRRRTENIPPKRHRSKQQKKGGEGGAGWRGGTFLFRHKFNMSDMTAGTRRREGRSRMLARGPSCRLCSSCSLGLLARSAQYIFMKDVTGGGRASCGRREAVNVPQACFHVASQVMDSRLEAPCSVRHCREHFYLIAYLAREFTRNLQTQTDTGLRSCLSEAMSCLLTEAIGSCMLPHLSQVFGTPDYAPPGNTIRILDGRFFLHTGRREGAPTVC